MKRFIGILFAFLAMGLLAGVLGVAMAVSDPEDQEGSKDPPLFNRMPNFYIYSYEDIEFDRFEFQISSEKTQAVEGRRYSIQYYLKSGAKMPSALQIGRNYINARWRSNQLSVINYQ